MNCRQVRDALTDAVAGSTADVSLADHLASCPACRAFAERLLRVDRVLAAESDPPLPAELRRRTLERIDRDRPGRVRALRWAMALGAPILLVGLGLFVLVQDEARALFSGSANALAGREETVALEQIPDRHVKLVPPEEGEADLRRYRVGPGMPVNGQTAPESRLAKQSRLVPVYENGRQSGIRVHGLRSGSDLDKIGLKNGDVIASIDGQPLSAPDRALEAYAQHGRGEDFELGLRRAGEDVTLRVPADLAKGENAKLIADPTPPAHGLDLADLAEKQNEATGKTDPVLGFLIPDRDGDGVVDAEDEDGKRVAQEHFWRDESGQVGHDLGGELRYKGKEKSPPRVAADVAKAPDPQQGQIVLTVEKPAPASGEDGPLRVDSKPAFSQVTIDGAKAGYTPDQAQLDPGVYRIELKRQQQKAESKTGADRAAGDDAGWGVELPPADQAAPDDDRSRADKPMVMGSLDRQVVQRALDAHADELAACTGGQGDFEEGARVRFHIGSDGQVGGARVDGARLDEATRSCLRRGLESLRFPAPKGGGLVVVQVPLQRIADAAAEPAALVAGLRGESERLDGLSFLPASGYFENTYLPGDPTTLWLQQSLADGLFVDGQALDLDQQATAYVQPFDAPENDGLALQLSTDRLGVDGPARVRLQVGLKGSDRLAKRRAPLNAVLVVDLRALGQESDRRTLWSLADSLAGAAQAGDRFWLVAAGSAEPVLLDPARFDRSAARRELADALLALEQGSKPASDLLSAMSTAYDLLSSQTGPDAPLGSNLVLMASAGGLGQQADALMNLAHEKALAGVSTSTLGVGAGADGDAFAGLALSGQGRRRHVAGAGQAHRVLEEELAASGAVVARAVRLRIRLAPGVRLIKVLGAQPLNLDSSERVRQAEQAIDRRVADTMGIQADRGQDEEGIQIVIPAFYASDAHVVLLDLVTDQPGPLADVQVRYKDLVNMKNNVSMAHLRLDSGRPGDDPRTVNVKKNLLAFELSADLAEASRALRAGQADRCREHLNRAAARVILLREQLPQLRDDPELERDRSMLLAYRRVLRDAHLWQAELAVREHLSRSLDLASRKKVALWQGR